MQSLPTFASLAIVAACADVEWNVCRALCSKAMGNVASWKRRSTPLTMSARAGVYAVSEQYAYERPFSAG